MATATESEKAVRRIAIGPNGQAQAAMNARKPSHIGHSGQPDRGLWFRGGLDGTGADVPVQPERSPAGKNENSGCHGPDVIARVSACPQLEVSQPACSMR